MALKSKFTRAILISLHWVDLNQKKIKIYAPGVFDQKTNTLKRKNQVFKFPIQVTKNKSNEPATSSLEFRAFCFK